MKTTNLDPEHQLDVTRGRKNPDRAASSGVTVRDNSTTAGPIWDITVIGGTWTDNGDGTAVLTIGGTPGSPGSGTDYDYAVAASDSDPRLQALATAVCDGTADEVEINAAIAAAVAADRPYSILLMPGTYAITGAVDFTPLTSMNGKWIVFEASGTTIEAGANLTTMIKLDPSAGGQIVTCLDLRLGKLSGNDTGGRTVTQIVNMARFSDNFIRIAQIVDGSGIGFKVSQSGVSDFPSGNNTIDIEIIHTLDGNAMTVTGQTGAYGFQGNSVHIGEIIGTANGIVLGASANQDATYNSFYLGVIEHLTGNAIQDYCGGNTWIVGNMNSNGKHLAGPTGMTLRSTYRVHIDLATAGTVADTAVLDQHYVQINGASYGRLLIAEKASTPATPGSGFGDVYFKSDGKLYSLNDAGAEVELASASGSAPSTADFLVGTAQAGLSAEIVVGATPGGELGGTWASPTVDATHSGSAHLALGSTSTTAAAGDHTHASSAGATPLLADDASSPFVFDDLLQNDLGTAWLFPDA